MKKIICIISLTGFLAPTLFAQFNRPTIIKKQTEPVTKTLPAQTSPEAPVYRLTAVKVAIRTGADNKEYPSRVNTSLGSRSGPVGAYFKQDNLTNEMKANTTTEFGMEKIGTGEMTLSALQEQGIKFSMRYFANFQFDAWRIEGIVLTLEFRDQNGNLHPTYGQKTINFSNATGFLNGYFETTMTCTTDGYFNPLTAQISR